MASQRVGLPDPVDPNDKAEVAGPPGRDPGECVLEHGRLTWSYAKCSRAGEKRVRRRLASQMLLLGCVTVDDLLEQLQDPGSDQDVAAVCAGRHHRSAQADVTSRMDVTHGALIRLHALIVNQMQKNFVLAITQPIDRLGAWRVAGPPSGSSIPRDARNERTPS